MVPTYPHPLPPIHWTPIVALPVSVAVIVVVIVAGAGGDWLLAKKESLQRKELLCIYYDYYAVYSTVSGVLAGLEVGGRTHYTMYEMSNYIRCKSAAASETAIEVEVEDPSSIPNWDTPRILQLSFSLCFCAFCMLAFLHPHIYIYIYCVAFFFFFLLPPARDIKRVFVSLV